MNYRTPPGDWDVVLQMERGSRFYFHIPTRRYAVASRSGSLTTGNLALEIDRLLPRLPERFDLHDVMALSEHELDAEKRRKVEGWQKDPEAFARFKNYLGRQLYYLRYLGLIEQINTRGEVWTYRKLHSDLNIAAGVFIPEDEGQSPRRYILARLEELDREAARIEVERKVLRLALAQLD